MRQKIQRFSFILLNILYYKQMFYLTNKYTNIMNFLKRLFLTQRFLVSFLS